MTNSRRQCLAGASCRVTTFEEAVDCLGHHSERKLPEIAERVHRDYRYLSKAMSLDASSHPFRGDLVVPVTQESAALPTHRNHVLLDWMEAQVGRVAFVMPTAAAGDISGDVVARAQHAIEQFGELLQRSGRTDADGNGVVNAADVALVEQEGREVMAAVAALVESWKAQAAIVAPSLRLARQA